AQPLEFLGILKESHKLGNLFNCLINAGHIFEGRLVALLGEQPGLTLAKTQGTFARHLDLADKEKPNKSRNNDEWQYADGHTHQQRIGFTRRKLRQRKKLVL